MRVAVVSPYNPAPTPGAASEAVVGGVERALDATATALARRGLDVTLHVTSNVPGYETREGVRVRRVRRRAVVHRAPLSSLPFRVFRDADVVHVPATYPTVSDLVPLLGRARGVPVVLDYHFDVHGTSPGMRAASAVYGATLGRAMRLARRVVVKTEDYASRSPVVSRFPAERLRVVPNGVHAERFRGARPAPDVPANAVLCVGRLVPYKGVDVLARAMALVQRDLDAPLVVAGDGPERARIEGIAREGGVDARFLGFVPDEALPGLYAAARVTVLPSVNGQEAFGITLLESMAAGTPVVASDLPGVRTVARVGGLLAPPGDARALADAVRLALKSDLPRGRDLADRVAREHSWDAVAARFEAVYEEVVG